MDILVKIGSFQIKQNILNLKSTLAVQIFNVALVQDFLSNSLYKYVIDIENEKIHKPGHNIRIELIIWNSVKES